MKRLCLVLILLSFIVIFSAEARAACLTTIEVAGTAPQAIAINPVTNKIYVANRDSNNISIFNGSTHTKIADVSVGTYPLAIAVNPNTNRIYVLNNSTSNVSVIDGATNTKITDVGAGGNPWFIAVNPNTNKIYVSNCNMSGNGTVSVIDGSNNTKIKDVTVGRAPYCMAINPSTNKIYVANMQNYNLSVINGADDTVLTTIGDVGIQPELLVVNPNNNKIYVTSSVSREISVINGATDTKIATVYTAANPAYVGMVVNPNNNMVYVGNGNYNLVEVIDGTTNALSAEITVPSVGAGIWEIGCPMAVNPITNRIWVGNNADSTSISEIDAATNAVTTYNFLWGYPSSTGYGCYSLAVNPNTNIVYIAHINSGQMSVLDASTNTTSTITVGTKPCAAAANPWTNKIYIANNGSNNVSVIDGATDAKTTDIAVGTAPTAEAINPVTNKIYVVNRGSNNVSIINGATDAKITDVTVGTTPCAVAVNPNTNKIYVANKGSNNISVIDGAGDTKITDVAVGLAPTAVDVNPITNRIYVANSGSTYITVLNGADNSTIATAEGYVTNSPISLLVNPITNRIYVAHSGSYWVSIINGATNTNMGQGFMGNQGYNSSLAFNPASNLVYAASAANSQPVHYLSNYGYTIQGNFGTTATRRWVAVNPNSNKVYVANQNLNNVTVIDGIVNTGEATITTGTSPDAIAVNPITNKIYVANWTSGTVTVIKEAVINTVPLTTSINTFTSDTTNDNIPNFSGTATTTRPNSTVKLVGIQLDTTKGSWTLASGTAPWSATAPSSLSYGLHTVYAVPMDDTCATTCQVPDPSYAGNIKAYQFRILQTTPLAPSSFIGTAESATSIRWSWTDVAGEDGYFVQDNSHVNKASTAANVTSTVETGLSANTQYIRHVNAYNSGGSAESGSDSRYTWASIPTGLATVELTESSARLFWSGNGTRYAVEKATQEAGPWTYIATWENNIATTEYTDTGLTSGATYWYRARAYNAEQVAGSPCSAISTTTIIVASSYTTKVGSNEEWSWKNSNPGDKVPSGTIEDWFWRTWTHNSGRKVPSGEAKDWKWENE